MTFIPIYTLCEKTLLQLMAVNLYQKNKYFLSTDFSSPWWTEGPRYISARRQSWSDSHINRVTGALSRIKVELSGRNWYTILLLYVLCLTFFTAMSSPIIILSMDPHSPRVVAFPPGQTHQDINRPSGQLFPRTLHVWRSIADEPKLKNAK